MVCNIGLAINVLTNRGHPLQKNVRNLVYVILEDEIRSIVIRLEESFGAGQEFSGTH